MSENLPGQVISQFELESIIGKGTQAVVYKAYQPTLNRWVAVKVLRPGYQDVMNRFEAEARVITRFQHPNIVDVYEFGQETGFAYVAMQYAVGGTLRDHLLHRPMDWRLVLKLIIPIGAALQ